MKTLLPLQCLPLLCLLVFLGVSDAPTTDDGTRFILPASYLEAGRHHTRHVELLGKFVTGYNLKILEAIDKVQATAMDGGGYFTGAKSKPTESPIGYPLKLFGKPLIDPPRTTSYCSGASCTAFIEALNMMIPDGAQTLSKERLEAMRMQEPDGGRREDWIKFWGNWNADGPGTQYALVQYTGMGQEIKPIQLRPGDFVNINWTSGLGHSVIFLGWHEDEHGNKFMRYWSSQTGTNGLGEQSSKIEKIESVKCTRLTDPGKLFTFDPATKIERKVTYDRIEW